MQGSPWIWPENINYCLTCMVLSNSMDAHCLIVNKNWEKDLGLPTAGREHWEMHNWGIIPQDELSSHLNWNDRSMSFNVIMRHVILTTDAVLVLFRWTQPYFDHPQKVDQIWSISWHWFTVNNIASKKKKKCCETIIHGKSWGVILILQVRVTCHHDAHLLYRTISGFHMRWHGTLRVWSPL